MKLRDHNWKAVFGNAPASTSTYELGEELNFERALTDNALRTIVPASLPEDLPLRIRLALSHERVRKERKLLGRLQHRLVTFLENSLRPIALHVVVAAVAVCAVAGGILMLGALAPQQAVQANDIPLTGFSAPVFLYSLAEEQPVVSSGDEPLMVQAKVDRTGRVYDYQVLSGTLTDTAAMALRQRMLSGVFRPAEIFGESVPGTVVLTFSGVVVRG